MIFHCLSTLFTFLWVTWLCFVFTECSLNLKHRWRAHMWRFNPGKGLTILIFPHQQGSVLMKISILNYSNFKWAPFQGKKNHDLAGWTQNRWNNSDVHYSVVFCHLYVSCWGVYSLRIYPYRFQWCVWLRIALCVKRLCVAMVEMGLHFFTNSFDHSDTSGRSTCIAEVEE